jgi:hypothetical protein
VITVIARYALFEDKAEFARFASVLKTYGAPVLIVVAVAFSAVISYVMVRKVGQERQERLINILSWFGWTIAAIVILGGLIFVKLGFA